LPTGLELAVRASETARQRGFVSHIRCVKFCLALVSGGAVNLEPAVPIADVCSIH
jgi:hypothetical protein